MGISFGGELCSDPLTLRDQLARQDLPCPWFGKPNVLECPAGVQSGTGWVLLSRASLDNLDLDTLYPLVFTSQEAPDGSVSFNVTLQSILAVEAVCVTPGLAGDPASAYLLRLADRRHLYQHIPLDKAYNVSPTLTPASGLYLSATLDAGVPWTWEGMVEDIWDTVGQLGDFPGLPVTPEGTPENWTFYGWYAMDALGQVLDSLSCTLQLDPVNDTFDIVQLAPSAEDDDEDEDEEDDADNDDVAAEIAAAQDANRDSLVWDDFPMTPARANVPEQVRVYFLKEMAFVDQSGASPYDTLDQSDPSPDGPLEGTEPGTKVSLFDDLRARYDASNTLLNATDLETRALERATDYFRVVRLEHQRRIYFRPLDDASLLPGPEWTSLRWGDRGAGMVTEIGGVPQPVTGAIPVATIVAEQFIKVTSASPQTITLPGGTTIPGYPARLDGWTNSNGVWSDGVTVWFLGANGETPSNGTRYLCKQLGVDASGVGIWSVDIPTSSTPDFGNVRCSTSTQAITASYTSVLSVTLNNNGLYLVTAYVSGEGEFTGALGTNTTCEAILSGSSLSTMPGAIFLAPQNNSGNLFYGSASLSAVVTAGAGDVVSLKVQFANTSSAGWGLANVLGGTAGQPGTWMSFAQIG